MSMELGKAIKDSVKLLDTMDWIRESNLIEGVDDDKEDGRSFRAWNWFLKQDLNVFSLLELHRKVMRNHFTKSRLLAYLGKYRTVNVHVGPRVCPQWHEIPKLMRGWFADFTEPKTPEHIMFAHIEFEKTHPFIDGNGRVGRMVMNYQRVKIGLPPLCIKAVARQDYYRWFEEDKTWTRLNP